MSEIKIRPEELMDTAEFLTKEHEAIVELVGKMVKEINNTVENWAGASQLQFVDTFTEQMAPALQESLPQVLEGISNQLKCSAETMKQTDDSVSDALKNK